MSRAKSTIVQNQQFVDRFIEVCGTTKPTEIAQMFNISYQAAKNYLAGRYPDTGVLINIGKTTDYSIHWLLTGSGPKFANAEPEEELLSVEMKALIKKECEYVVTGILGGQVAIGKEKVIVLSAKDIKEEKVLEESSPISLNRT